MKAFFSTVLVFTLLTLNGLFAFAQEVAAPSPAPAVSAPAVVAAAPLPPQDFLSQVLQAIQGFGGLSTVAKISVIILLLVSSMKVTALNQLIWSKLGKAQAWVAPLLGLVAGILGLANGADQKITLASVMAYVASGAGAILLYELLDSLQAIPGIGPTYVSIIEFIKGLTGGPKSQA